MSTAIYMLERPGVYHDRAGLLRYRAVADPVDRVDPEDTGDGER